MIIKRCQLAFALGEQQIYKSIESIQCKPDHSFSAIFAISDFLIKQAIFPTFPSSLVQILKVKTTPEYNPLNEFWNKCLEECVTNQKAIRQEQQFYVWISAEHLHCPETVRTSKLFKLVSVQGWKELSNRQKASKLFQVAPKQNKKKIGIYLTHPTKQDYLPNFSMSANFIGILFNNQKWSIFDIPKGQIPSVPQLCHYDSIIITGSSYSVLDQTQQIKMALLRLMEAYQTSGKLRIVGVCYGHQLLALHFGGEVVKKKLKGSVQKIYFKEEVILKNQFLNQLNFKNALFLTQHHQDFVQTVPNGFQLLGQSESCKVEALISKDGRILTSQFHSQLFYKYMQEAAAARKSLSLEDLGFTLGEQRKMIQENHNSSMKFLQILRKFMSC